MHCTSDPGVAVGRGDTRYGADVPRGGGRVRRLRCPRGTPSGVAVRTGRVARPDAGETFGPVAARPGPATAGSAVANQSTPSEDGTLVRLSAGETAGQL